MLPPTLGGFCSTLRLSVTAICLSVLCYVSQSHAAVIVDDSNPTLRYSGPWTNVSHIHYPNITGATDYNGTLTYTTSVGALVQFNFTGSSVIVYGIVSPAFNVAVRSTLDGVMNPSVFVVNGSTTTTEIHHYPLYISGTMPFDAHTITLENIGDQLWIDSIEVASAPPLSPSAATIPSTTAGNFDEPTSSANASRAATTSGVSDGAIGGIVVAATVAILAALVLALYCRERRQRIRGAGHTSSHRMRPAGALPNLGYGSYYDRRSEDDSDLITTLPPAYHP
ncbi:hypothetical protein PYCCODRAFT_82221 [Trametes coccinea BRFM310]|uniref:Mid2 domain-containing protein n=1 Tax=Trametes coccinea (strain BRFM310) TaxID=1353009 RepID=A0A1Y2IUZ2_TRAC3|nr:hypothetical protein PYCCODRAFT_82221 [Trametes coccinea BRFM310]